MSGRDVLELQARFCAILRSGAIRLMQDDMRAVYLLLLQTVLFLYWNRCLSTWWLFQLAFCLSMSRCFVS